ncbi:transporter substrate-binding domain-containing protein [Streptosporangium algeriense]|uniref:Transporter substrate-binding domain-containing protein n=1 Tax=Streptosporangium algeriense TaxID=1682748 RepID=A0ABW3DNT6_9ACTN
MRSRRLSSAALAATTLFALSACGGSPEGPGSAASPASSAPLPGNRTAGKVTAPADLAGSKTITYCSTFTNPPRSYTENGAQVGAEVDLGKALATTLGLTPKWVQVRVDGIVPALLGGQCDMIVSQLKITPDRDATAWQLPYSIAATQLVVAKGNPKGIGDFASLSGKKVAAPDGTVAHDLLEQMNKIFASSGRPPAQIVPLSGTTDLFQQVAAGVIDAAATTFSAGSYYIGKAPDRLEMAGEPCLSDVKAGGRMGFMIAKADEELFHAMEKAMTAVRESGEYKEIFHRYALDKETLDAAEASNPVACVPAEAGS